MKLKLPYYAGLVGLAAAGLLPAQSVDHIEREGDQIRVESTAPKMTLQSSHDGAQWQDEQEESLEDRLRQFLVPMTDQTRFLRTMVTLGGVDFGSLPVPLFPPGTIPNPETAKPERISLNGDVLTLAFPPELHALADDPAFENGFPLVTDHGVVNLAPRERGQFSAQLPGELVQEFRKELQDGLARLHELGNGTVPRFMGRQFTGEVPVPDPASVGGDLTLFPFDARPNDGQVALSSGVPILGSAAAVDPAKSLAITDLSVVEDPLRTYDPVTGLGTPMGKWTFGFLMQEMANTPLTGIDPKDFTRRWIRHFETPQVVNFEFVGDRLPNIRTDVIDPWVRRNVSLGRAPFDLREAPFRLTAIVNRIDLRSGSGYSAGDAGELRFVFCALNLDTGFELPFTVIFEFGVPISGCRRVKAYARDWWNMKTVPFGPGFNARLESLTDIVSLANADPSKPNGSAINQIRTNEILVGVWDLREFVVEGAGSFAHHLVQTTTKQTPQMAHQGMPDLANYVNTFEPDILAGAHVVPLTWAGSPFLSGHAEMPSAGFHWNAPGIANNDARHCFSLNTCNGCHSGETGGTPFVHISTRPPGVEALLSDFMTGAGMPKADPVSGVPRVFDDLKRRAADLDFVAHMPCFLIAVFPTFVTSH